MRSKEIISEYPKGKKVRSNPRELVFKDDIALIEMANLPPSDTGVNRIIYISSMQGSRGPRVKWYTSAPKKNSPCLSVSISSTPEARNLKLPIKVAEAAAPSVIAWVALNHVELLDFWNNGYSWTRQQVSTFIDNLKKI